ncbi:DUF3330 domain-containing protein [Ectothiorhodospiraceae bacterium 2226]|nr:DUF3330 domain-containing protein [Ectothiorhodospiraceae bacterium 2226]
MSTETRPQPKEPEHLSCAQCKKEIPASTVVTSEGGEYVLHFCGVECMDAWKREKNPQSPR